MKRIITTFTYAVISTFPGCGSPEYLAKVLKPAKIEMQPTSFVWPKTVAEFLDFDPNYVDKWLMSKKCALSLVADFRQSLLLHLCTPTKECIRRGIQDKLGLYNPGLRGNATTIQAWANWLGESVLQHEYSKLINKQKRGHTEGPDVISLSEDDVDATSVHPSWWRLMEENERKQFNISPDSVFSKVTSSMLVKELMSTIESEVGGRACQTLDAVVQTDTIAQAADLMGVRPRTIHQTLRDTRSILGSVIGAPIVPLVTRSRARSKNAAEIKQA